MVLLNCSQLTYNRHEYSIILLPSVGYEKFYGGLFKQIYGNQNNNCGFKIVISYVMDHPVFEFSFLG